MQNGLKAVNARRFPFNFHRSNTGKCRISRRGESFHPSSEESEAEVEDSQFLGETVKMPPGAPRVANIREVKKLPPFRAIDPMLVSRDHNPRLPNFRVLEPQVFPLLLCSVAESVPCLVLPHAISSAFL